MRITYKIFGDDADTYILIRYHQWFTNAKKESTVLNIWLYREDNI